MGDLIDPKIHIGEVHGIYTITDVLEEKDKYGHYIYKGVCNICGYEKFSHYGGFSGETHRTTQCNHLRANGNPIVYGYTWTNQRIGRIFKGMTKRCYDSNDKNYRWYGKKGICICKEWLNNPKLFEEWALNNGYADNLTIDREDPNKDYCPENCKWITLEENSRKAGVVHWITVGQTTLTGRQWSDKLSLGPNTINTALREYGLAKTEELIKAMLVEPPSEKHRKRNQTWFSVYGIQI